MAGSIRSVITENGLVIYNATDMAKIGLRLVCGQQVMRCSGILPDGLRCVTYGWSIREAVNKWLDMRDAVRAW